MLSRLLVQSPPNPPLYSCPDLPLLPCTSPCVQNEAWRQAATIPFHRQRMCQQIIQILINQKPHASLRMRTQLLVTTPRLERVLFQESRNVDEYRNPDTIKWRLLWIFQERVLRSLPFTVKQQKKCLSRLLAWEKTAGIPHEKVEKMVKHGVQTRSEIKTKCFHGQMDLWESAAHEWPWEDGLAEIQAFREELVAQARKQWQRKGTKRKGSFSQDIPQEGEGVNKKKPRKKTNGSPTPLHVALQQSQAENQQLRRQLLALQHQLHSTPTAASSVATSPSSVTL